MSGVSIPSCPLWPFQWQTQSDGESHTHTRTHTDVGRCENGLCVIISHFSTSLLPLNLSLWYPKQILHLYIFKIRQFVTLAFSLHLNLFVTNAVVRSIVRLTSRTLGEPGGIDRVLRCEHQVSELFPQRG